MAAPRNGGPSEWRIPTGEERGGTECDVNLRPPTTVSKSWMRRYLDGGLWQVEGGCQLRPSRSRHVILVVELSFESYQLISWECRPVSPTLTAIVTSCSPTNQHNNNRLEFLNSKLETRTSATLTSDVSIETLTYWTSSWTFMKQLVICQLYRPTKSNKWPYLVLMFSSKNSLILPSSHHHI